MKKSAEVPKVTKSKTTLDAAVPKRTRAPRKTATPLVVAAEERVSPEGISDWTEPTVEEIARRAYEISQSREEHDGDSLSDWLQAERELRLHR